ncbi:MAG: OmpA family protein [Pseudomonadota bacterium]
MFLNKNGKLRAILISSVSVLAVACADSELDFAGPSAGDSLNRSGLLGVSTSINQGAQVLPSEEMLKNLTRMFASEVPATINFDFDRAELDDDARAALRAQARWILDHPAVKFRIFGHTDRPGSNAYNRSLGKRRADAAVNFMISLGVPRERIDAVASFGETRPLVLTQGRSRQNRRTVTEVVAFVKPFDGELDGKYAVNVYEQYVSRYARLTDATTRTLSETTPGGE